MHTQTCEQLWELWQSNCLYLPPCSCEWHFHLQPGIWRCVVTLSASHQRISFILHEIKPCIIFLSLYVTHTIQVPFHFLCRPPLLSEHIWQGGANWSACHFLCPPPPALWLHLFTFLCHCLKGLEKWGGKWLHFAVSGADMLALPH